MEAARLGLRRPKAARAIAPLDLIAVYRRLDTYLSDQPLALMKERGTYFVPPISFFQEMIVRDGFRCVRLNLWDEERKKLVPLPKP